jgi:hypothetical protein
MVWGQQTLAACPLSREEWRTVSSCGHGKSSRSRRALTLTVDNCSSAGITRHDASGLRETPAGGDEPSSPGQRRLFWLAALLTLLLMMFICTVIATPTFRQPLPRISARNDGAQRVGLEYSIWPGRWSLPG